MIEELSLVNKHTLPQKKTEKRKKEKFPTMKSYRKFPNTFHVAIPAEVLQATSSSKFDTLPSKKYLKIILVLAILVIFLASSSLFFSREQKALVAKNAITIPVLSYDPNIIGGDNIVFVHRNEKTVVHESLLKFKSDITHLYKIISWWFSSANKTPSTKPTIFNVHDFGAKGDGITDDSEAFKEAWKRACSSEDHRVVLLVPNNNYMLKPIKFFGPCKSDHLTMKIKGTMRASQNRSDYKLHKVYWLQFQKINNFTVEGGGVIDGNGRIWWQSSCKFNKSLPCRSPPNALNFVGCNNLKVDNLRFRNAQKMHLTFLNSVNVKAWNLKISAPEDSPNTDGIHVTRTHNLKINNCVIGTGDDCISIVGGSTNIRVTNITCGPGHGISIGSLGARNFGDYVSNVVVNRAVFSGTTNGVRIKTWQGGFGYAKNIRFQNITMQNVGNPIIIDQHYCDRREPCSEQVSAVKISNVVYSNIKGTSNSKVALRFDCNNNFPCQKIFLQDVDLQPHDHERVEASCKNVMLKQKGRIFPSCS